MPTYYSLGVTATLSVAPLDASLSTVVELKGGDEQRKDARRIEDVMANGRVLPEKPLPPPGQKGAQQFLGADQDMPFMMVLAGDTLKGTLRSNRSASASESSDAAAAAAMMMLATGQKHQHSYETRSTQKSTTETSRPARQASDESKPSSSGKSGKKREDRGEAIFSLPYRMRSIQQAPSTLRKAADPQALCLTIETFNESFLPASDRSGRSSNRKNGRNNKALKVEVFVNGQLAGVSFVNRRGSAVEYNKNKIQFQGTRIHRQSEKPWVYTGNAKMQVGQDGNDDTNDSLFVEEASKGNERWTKINAALEQEALARGRNDAGDMPPSAEFLEALSELKVPQSVEGNESIGIIDVIVTVGTGKKYGPEHGYLSEPSRMDDNTYSILNDARDPAANALMQLGQEAEEASPFFDPSNRGTTSAYTGYPITPARKRRDSGSSVRETPTKKQKTTPADLAKKFGLEGVDLKQMIDGYETSMGKVGVQQRNLSQRLTDLAKMNPTNQEKQLAVLKGQLGEGIVQRAPVEAEEKGPLPASGTLPVHSAAPYDGPDSHAQLMGKSLLDTNSRLYQRMVSSPSAPPSHVGGGNDALPSDWAETASPHGNTYYYNRVGMTTWQRPDGTVPLGWFEAIAANGSKYYYNRALGTTTWQRPAMPGSGAPVEGTEGLPAVAADDHPAKTPVSAFGDAGDVMTTRASAIAGASCRVPVKPQRKAKKKASAPPAHVQDDTLIYGNGDDAFPVDPSIAATTAAFGAITVTDEQDGIRSGNNNASGTGSRSANPFGLGANRTRNAWNPHEKSPQKTLEEYKVPELSRGSCVSYSEDATVQRQVGKARNGEFKEEAVVWGVRFLVI
ncbi:hypothetical protein D0862_06503 [Hortaea werneckii]|uniref:WW domain-containing protein n=2 Tax=Hortaea werneckii TaxID=91943 RepID=A0A3M7GJD4_HORWE|nr:hypothetical protein D0862_06503 [Hortaea werneckii]